MIQIRQAQESDRESIFELRKEAYAEFYGDSAAANGLVWNEFDSRGLVLVAESFAGKSSENPPCLVSTMRISLLANSSDFERVMTFPAELVKVQLPVISINRLATRKPFRSHGLIGQMRQIAIHLAEIAGVNSVIGSSESSSAHFQQLHEIGYSVTDLPIAWTGFLKNKSPILLGVLSNHQFPSAIAKLSQRLKQKSTQTGFEPASVNISYETALAHLLKTKLGEP